MQKHEQMYRQVATLTEDTYRKLENSGLRMTVQRRHIIDILLKSECSSPKELWYEARQFVPDLGIATVYRLINRLEQLGILAKARNLGISKTIPEMGKISYYQGQPVALKNPIQLKEVIRRGLISYGIIGINNDIEVSLTGEQINIEIIS